MAEHRAIVPTAGGVPPSCECGFVGGAEPGSTLTDHLRDEAMRVDLVEYYDCPPKLVGDAMEHISLGKDPAEVVEALIACMEDE